MYTILLCFHSEIIEAPTALTVALNSTATFHCKAIAELFVRWEIDGLPESTNSIVERGIAVVSSPPDPITGVQHSTLTIPATPVNNGTRIQCLAIDTVVITSAEVTLQIQGMSTFST